MLLSLLTFSGINANTVLAKSAYYLGDHLKSAAVILAMKTSCYPELTPLAMQAIPYGKIIFHPITPLACYATGSALKISAISSKYPQTTGKDAKLYAAAKDSCQDIFALKKSLLVMGVGQLFTGSLMKRFGLRSHNSQTSATIMIAASFGMFVAEKKVNTYLDNKLKETVKENAKNK